MSNENIKKELCVGRKCYVEIIGGGLVSIKPSKYYWYMVSFDWMNGHIKLQLI